MAKEGMEQLSIDENLPDNIEEFRPNIPMKPNSPNKLLSPTVERKYQGEFVALCTGRKKRVIAHADTYGALLEAVNKMAKHPLFSIISVPREGTLYSH